MQKKIIALAIAAAASSAAFAQTNVTMYGIVDAGLAQYRASGAATSSKLESGLLSTSRIGFKGTEDLGNGLKALFVLEYRLDVDSNNTLGGTRNAAPDAGGPARQQLVGLTGGFGTVAAGRLQTTAFDWQGKYETLTATAFDVTNQLTKNNFRFNLSNDSRANNAIAYISPSMAGVTVAVNHSFAAEQAVATNAAASLGATLVGVYYDNGPLSLGLIGEKLQGNGATEGTERTDMGFGASYDFGVAKLTGTYQTTKNQGALAAGEIEKRDAVWSVGAQVPVSAKGKVHVLYAGSKIQSTAADDNGKGVSIAYTHDLSKRTTAYAGFGWMKNGDEGKQFGFGVAAGSSVINNGSSSNVVGAGLRHTF